MAVHRRLRRLVHNMAVPPPAVPGGFTNFGGSLGNKTYHGRERTSGVKAAVIPFGPLLRLICTFFVASPRASVNESADDAASSPL